MANVDIPFRELACGFAFAEGPVALGDGSVIVCDVPIGRVWRVESEGAGRARAGAEPA